MFILKKFPSNLKFIGNEIHQFLKKLELFFFNNSRSMINVLRESIIDNYCVNGFNNEVAF